MIHFIIFFFKKKIDSKKNQLEFSLVGELFWFNFWWSTRYDMVYTVEGGKSQQQKNRPQLSLPTHPHSKSFFLYFDDFEIFPPPLPKHPLCASTEGCSGLSHATFCLFPLHFSRLHKHRRGVLRAFTCHKRGCLRNR